MFNAKKMLSALARKVPIYKEVASGSMANSVANQWFYTNLNFTVPAGHTYLVRASAGFSMGKPIGLGIHNATTIPTALGAPSFVHEESYVSFSPCWMVPTGTWYLFCKRSGSSGSYSNAYSIYALDLKISGGGTA